MTENPTNRPPASDSPNVSPIADELVELAQVRPAHRGDDLSEPTRRADALFDELFLVSPGASLRLCDRLRGVVMPYEDGNGTSARNPVLDAIVGRALAMRCTPEEKEVAIDMIDRGGYPLQMNDILALGVAEAARLISPYGFRARHLMTDVGAMTMVLQGRSVRPNRILTGIGPSQAQALRQLGSRIANADVPPADQQAVTGLITTIDSVIDLQQASLHGVHVVEPAKPATLPFARNVLRSADDLLSGQSKRRDMNLSKLVASEIGIDTNVLLSVGVADALETVRADGPTSRWLTANLRALSHFLTSPVDAWEPRRADIEALVGLRDDLLVPNRYNAGVIGDGQVVSILIGQISALAHALKVLPVQDAQ